MQSGSLQRRTLISKKDIESAPECTSALGPTLT
jgi:hypothetical protein